MACTDLDGVAAFLHEVICTLVPDPGTLPAEEISAEGAAPY